MSSPRTIFRSRRKRPVALVVGDRPAAPYVRKVVEAGKRLTPGTITVAEIWHDSDCRRPQGCPCTCQPNVTMRALTDPENN
jgi:hypothetical protein